MELQKYMLIFAIMVGRGKDGRKKSAIITFIKLSYMILEVMARNSLLNLVDTDIDLCHFKSLK